MANKDSVERIDTGAFMEAIEAMNRAVKCFQSARSKIIRFTDPVMDSWQGNGAKSFGKVYKKLKTELEDEETNLVNIRDSLQSVKESYEGWDAELAAQFQQNGT